MQKIDLKAFMQLNERLAACLMEGNTEEADQLDAEMIQMVGTNNRVVYRRGVMPPVLTYMYAYNRCMLQMNHGHVQEAALSMIDVAETLHFGNVPQDIYFVFDMLAGLFGTRDKFSQPYVLACDYLLMAVLCERRFPAMSLSFFWKSHMLFNKLGVADLVEYTHAFIKVQYGLVAITYDKIDPEGARMFKAEADKINAVLKQPDRNQAVGNSQTVTTTSSKQVMKEQPVEDIPTDYIKGCVYRVKNYEDDQNLEKHYPEFKEEDSLLFKCFGHLDETDKDHLPNIMEVMELVCYDEEKCAVLYDNSPEVNTLFGRAHDRDGAIDTVVNPEGKFSYFPKGLIKNYFYRGQTKHHPHCYPSLYRDLSDKEQFIERLKLCEFELLLRKYPSTWLFEDGINYTLANGSVEHRSLNVDVEPLAQHYGIKTVYLDVTVDKWVAAFFACCDYCKTKVGEHDVYQKHEGETVGVFYVYQAEPEYAPDGAFRPLGVQPLSRPVLQAGYVRKLDEKQDFETMTVAIPFKYHTGCVGIIYQLFNRSGFIQPPEMIGMKAKRIVAEETSFSTAAFELAHQKYYTTMSDAEFSTMVTTYQLKTQPNPLVDFTDEELRKSVADRQIWEPYLWQNTRTQQIVSIDLNG